MIDLAGVDIELIQISVQDKEFIITEQLKKQLENLQETYELVKEVKAVCKKPGDYLFIGHNGLPVKTAGRNFSKFLKIILDYWLRLEYTV